MPTAKKTKSGSYSVSVYDYKDANGKQHYKRFTAPTKKEAEKLANQYKTGLTHISELNTVDEALEEYIKLKTAVLSPSTIKGYRAYQRTLKKDYPQFLSRRIKTITEKDMQGFVSAIATEKSPKTVKNIYLLIKPISASFKDFSVTLPTIVQYEPIIPTEEDILLLMNDVKGKELEVPVMLGAYCMMRRGEVCSLTMDDVNFKNKTIHIRHSKVMDEDNEWVVKTPKTKKSDRTISVADFVLEAIKEKGYITDLNPNELTERFERVLNRLKIGPFRFHDLRHYCASAFHYKGIPMSYTQKYGGWSTMDTLVKIYQHTLSDKEDEVYAVMTDYFSSKTQQS